MSWSLLPFYISPWSCPPFSSKNEGRTVDDSGSSSKPLQSANELNGGMMCDFGVFRKAVQDRAWLFGAVAADRKTRLSEA
jgi:hypothetical protein